MTRRRSRPTFRRSTNCIGRITRLLWALAVVGALAACTVTPTATPTGPPPSAAEAEIPELDPDRRPVFVSTDMSGDDTVALLYLLSHPEVQVLGIGSSEGVAFTKEGARNALRLVALVGREDVPVAIGKEGPLEGENAFPSSWRRGASQPLGDWAPEAGAEPVFESTSELLTKVVNANPGQVTVVILGAHTDVALALRNQAGLAERFKDILIMGGAVHAPGNIHKEYSQIANEVAEWNLWVDPIATAEVFAAGIPLHMVPLDATDLVKVDGAFHESFVAQVQSEAAKATAQLWQARAGSSSGFFIWDVVAAVALTLPDAAEWESLPIEVVVDEPDHEGWTRVADGLAPNAHVSVDVDASQILDEITRVLNHSYR